MCLLLSVYLWCSVCLDHFLIKLLVHLLLSVKSSCYILDSCFLIEKLFQLKKITHISNLK